VTPPPTDSRPGLLSIRSWRVRNRLTLLVLLPLLAAIALAATRINTLYDDQAHYTHARFQADTAISVEQLLLALQQERESAALCLTVITPCNTQTAGKNATDQNLVIQYTNAQTATSAAVATITPIAKQVVADSGYSQQLRQVAQEALGRTQDLSAIRQAVTTSQAPFTVSQTAYTGVIQDVVNVIGQASAGTSDASVTQDEDALSSVDNMIEAESVAQLYTAQVVQNGGGASELVLLQAQADGLNQALASYTASYSAFQTTSSAELIQSFQGTVSGPDVAQAQAATSAALSDLQQLVAYDQSASSSKPEINTQQLNAEVVNQALPVTLGDLRTVQTVAIDQMIQDSQSLLDGSRSDLYKNAALILAALIISFFGTAIVARSLVGPLQALRTGALDIAANRLPEIVRRLRDADGVDADTRVEPIPINSDDEIGQVARAFDEVHQQAVRLASEQAMLRANVNSMFVNLSRRSQSLVQRQLRLIDELENSEQDPDQLSNLFKLDHLATRMRRNGENLLVLAGEEPGRKWSQAVRLLDVMRAGASEVEQYERVALRDLPDVNVLGRVVNDLVHLVAELLENATSFSAPETKVSVTANMLNTGGAMLEIEDAGIGMTPEELDDANERLANPPVIDVAISRRMGLYVVGRLATRHGIQVRLRRSAGGGITALVLVPSTLLAGAEGEQSSPAELSATGARSLGALPRRAGGTQLGFPGEGADTPSAFRSASASDLIGPAVDEPPADGSVWHSPPAEDTDAFGLPQRQLRPQAPASDPLPERGAGAFGGDAFGDAFRPAPGEYGQSASIPGARAPFDDRPMPPRPPAQPPAPQQPFGDPASTGQFAKADPAGTGQFPRIKDVSGTGQFPKIKDPSGTGQFPKIKDPGSSGQFTRPSDPSGTGQFPKIGDPGGYPPPARPEPSATGQFPKIRDAAPAAPAPAAPPAPLAPPPAPLPAAPAQPAVAQSTVAERLFAAEPLPPAPATDERLPIFEAMESEWFRRRDEARAQASLAQTASAAAPAPAPAPVRPAAQPEAPAPAPAELPAAEPYTPSPGPSFADMLRSSGLAGTVPAAPQPPAQPEPAPAQPAEPSLATSGGDTPMENTSSWASTGDEGWKAAQAAAKPVAAGLTQKGLPKRVPKSNLVPGSAGGTGAAKATPPVMPPRSAEAVRGRLSSFHQGLRQGRDAAGGTGEGTEGARPDGTTQDGGGA
jgi:signal transduction histidine kinase